MDARGLRIGIPVEAEDDGTGTESTSSIMTTIDPSFSTTGGCFVGTTGCACTAGGGCDPGLECREGVCVPSDCAIGSLDCVCTPGGGCDPGLVCEGGVCVEPGETITATLGSSSAPPTTDGTEGTSTCGAPAETAVFTLSEQVETFVVPECVNEITIEAWGAQGGDNITLDDLGGLGARVRGDFAVRPGEVLSIVVGGRGANAISGDALNGAGGGGGGSFVWRTATEELLIAAGGGGGSSVTVDPEPHYWGKDGVVGTNGSGSRSHDQFGDAPGGVAGADGKTVSGSGGNGWITVVAFPDGRASCDYGGDGGYGGGGGAGCPPNPPCDVGDDAHCRRWRWLLGRRCGRDLLPLRGRRRRIVQRRDESGQRSRRAERRRARRDLVVVTDPGFTRRIEGADDGPPVHAAFGALPSIPIDCFRMDRRVCPSACVAALLLALEPAVAEAQPSTPPPPPSRPATGGDGEPRSTAPPPERSPAPPPPRSGTTTPPAPSGTTPPPPSSPAAPAEAAAEEPEGPPVDLSETWGYSRSPAPRPRYVRRSTDPIMYAPNPIGFYSGVSVEGNETPPHPVKRVDAPPATLTWVGFERITGGSRVFFQLSAEAKYEVSQKGTTIEVVLHKTNINVRNNMRELDLRYFKTPVRSVKVKRKKKDTIITVVLNRDTTPAAKMIGGKRGSGYKLLVLEFAHSGREATQAD